MPHIILRLVSKKDALTTWWDSLPPEILGNRAQSQAQLRATMHLRLEYCLVRMFVGRPFLLKNEPSSSPAASECRTPRSSGGHSSHGRDLVEDCIQAAKTALEICQLLRDCGLGLARASYTEYSSCRASLLVLIAYSIENRSEEFRKQLRDGLDMIREMSAAGDSARSEVSFIEALERALDRLQSQAQRARASEMDVNVAESPIPDYNAFKHWGVMWKNQSRSTLSPMNVPNAMSPRGGRPPISDITSPDYLAGLMDHGIPLDDTGQGVGVDTFRSFGSTDWSAYDAGNMTSGWADTLETRVLEQFLASPSGICNSVER